MHKKVVNLYNRENKVSGILLKDGKIPVALYGFNVKKGMSLYVEETIKNTLNNLGLSAYSTVFEVHANEHVYHCIIKEVQTDPITDRVIHLDFQSVGDDEKFMMYCPLRILNRDKCEALKSKCVLRVPHKLLAIECSLNNFVPSIDVDVGKLAKGQKIHAKDMPSIKFCDIKILLASVV